MPTGWIIAGLLAAIVVYSVVMAVVIGEVVETSRCGPEMVV